MSEKDATFKVGFNNSRPAPLALSPIQKRLFGDWILQKQTEIEAQIIRLSTRRNALALAITEAEGAHRGAYCPTDGQSTTPFLSRSARKLLSSWSQVDLEIRCLKNIETLLAPLYYLSCQFNEPDFITDDPITLFYWRQCRKDYASYNGINGDDQ